MKTCTAACGTNEYIDGTICKTCDSGIGGCSVCFTASGTLKCSTCKDGYWLSFDTLTCNKGCLGTDKYPY